MSTGTYKPTEHDGQKEDGGHDQRVDSDHGFGADRDFASEQGKVGGKIGGKTSDLSAEAQRPASDGEAFDPDAPVV